MLTNVSQMLGCKRISWAWATPEFNDPYKKPVPLKSDVKFVFDQSTLPLK